MSHQTWPIKRIKQGNNFQESFVQFGGLGQVPGSFQFSNPLHLPNNQLCQDSRVSFFFFFEKANKIFKLHKTFALKTLNINY